MWDLGSDLLWAAVPLAGSGLFDLSKQDGLVPLDVVPRDVQQPLDLLVAVGQLEGAELIHHCFDFLLICRKQTHTAQVAEYGVKWHCCEIWRHNGQNKNSNPAVSCNMWMMEREREKRSGSPAAGPAGLQTSAVGSVEERHVYDCRLLLFPFKHVTIFWPVSLLQDLVIYLWKRLRSVLSIFLCKSQGL